MKAKLVIDMPYNCYECRFRRPALSSFGYVCACKGKLVGEYDSTSIRPDWCPLEPVGEE